MGPKEVATGDVFVLVSVLSGFFSLAWLVWVGSSLSTIAASLKWWTDRQKAQDQPSAGTDGAAKPKEKPPFWV